MQAWNTMRATRGDRARRGAGQILRAVGRLIAKEVVSATLAFALLCGLAAALRNFILRRVTNPQ